MSNKPEWFEMAAEDHSSEISTPKSKKRLAKIALFTVPLLLAGGAMVFAEDEGEGDDAPKFDTTISTSTNATAVDNSNLAGSSSSAVKSQAVANPAAPNNPVNPVNPSNPSNPGKAGVGVPAPSAKGGDDDHEGFFGGDDDGEHEGREHEGRERHHEGGEHEGRAKAPTIPQTGTNTKN